VADVERLPPIGDPHGARPRLGFLQGLRHGDGDILAVVADDVVFEREPLLVNLHREIRHWGGPEILA
jgi:hypothetical protein